MKIIVYQAISPSGKCYIGITSYSLKERKRKHFNHSSRGKKGKFPQAIRKYQNTIVWKILKVCRSWKKAQALEQYYIQKFNSYENGYNCTLGGEGVLGHKAWNKGKVGIYTKEQILNNVLKNGSKPFCVYEKFSNKFIGTWISQLQCAKDLKLNHCHISSCLHENLKSHKGFTFKYIEDNHASI